MDDSDVCWVVALSICAILVRIACTVLSIIIR